MSFRRILALSLVLLLLLGFAATAHALEPQPLDFGDYGGGGDYGGDYGGGDYDYGGNDYDYDYGDDDDYDYGGGNYGGSYYSGGSSSDSPWQLAGSVITVLFVLIIFSLLKNKNKKNSKNGRRSVAPGPKPTDRSTLKPMAEYLTVDPGFNEAAFQEKLSNLYVQLQNCWMARDLSPLRPYLTDALLGQAQNQIDNYIRQNQIPRVERISVLSVELMGWRQDQINDTILCNLRTRIVDYVVDANTGVLVHGSNTNDKFMEYEWTMIRSVGRKTDPKTGVTEYHCESCGAPMNLNHSAKCEYCGAIATSTSYDWVLSNIRGISQHTSGN